MTAPSLNSNLDERTSATLLCECPIPLQDSVLRRRIYSPQSYSSVRNAAVVPIVHSEGAALASWFPLVWQRRQRRAEFVAIRALLDDQRAQPPAGRGLLPLILRAYPFVLDPEEPAGPHTRRMMDDVFADAPTDIGATITTVQRKLSRATTSRFRFLDVYALDATITAEIGNAIAGMDALEPWLLKFEIEGRRIEVPDLLVVRPSAYDDGRLAPLLQQFGLPCAQMLGLHRISLYRAGGLLTMAKAFLKDQRERAHGEGFETGPRRPTEGSVASDPSKAPALS